VVSGLTQSNISIRRSSPNSFNTSGRQAVTMPCSAWANIGKTPSTRPSKSFPNILRFAPFGAHVQIVLSACTW
jgi:hypothetical protein